MSLCACEFELRFVGHGLNQRMTKRELGARREHHLVDELRLDQFSQRSVTQTVGIREQDGQQIGAEPRSDDVAALSVRLAGAVSRSMRAPIVACRVGGTLTSSTSCCRWYAPRSATMTPRSAYSRTISWT